MSRENSPIWQIEEASSIMGKQRKINTSATHLSELHREMLGVLETARRIRAKIATEMETLKGLQTGSESDLMPQGEMSRSLSTWAQQMQNLATCICECFGADDEIEAVVGEIPPL